MKGCDRCDGGWMWVTETYVDRLAPHPAPLDEGLAAVEGTREAFAVIVEEVEARRGALRWSVYPCKDCNPPLFYRWAGGHFERNHDRAGCPECIELDSRRRTTSGRHAQRDLVRDGPTPVGHALPPIERRDLF